MNGKEISQKLSNLNNMATFTLKEKYDIVNSQKILHSDIIDDEYKGSLKKYLKHGKSGSVEVEYTQEDIGRLKIRVKGLKEDEGCINQSIMYREAKAALCKSNYVDLDMVNAHPTFMEQIFLSNKYPCPVLTEYNSDRNAFFTEMAKKGIDRDSCKKLIMTIFYGGFISTFVKDNKLTDADIPAQIYRLSEEMKSNSNKLLQTNELMKYRMKAIERKGSDYDNIDGTAMSYYLQTVECKALLVMYRYLINSGFQVGALIHDGLHLEHMDDNLDYDYQPIISKLVRELKDKTGLDIQLKIKPFGEVAELDEIIVIKTDKEGGAYISEKLKYDYIMSQERTFMRVDNVWTYNDKVIKRNLIRAVGNMNIFMKEGDAIRPYSTMAKSCMNMLQFVEPTEDPDFIDNLWSSNLLKLCFRNGYYDFKKSSLQPYDNETHTCVKINRDYEAPTKEDIQLVYDKILNPIFNKDKDLMECWLNYVARGLAGHVEDKNWGVGIGERDCGKGVLVGMLENCFGEYCRTTNSENFLYKNAGQDSAKALSWLVPFEFKRLLLTNEITIGEKTKINGNILKKLSSGGDKIEARVNHKDEINFKIQARVCMFCNDLPPIEPADAKETSYMFRYPSKFLAKDDDRLGKPLMRPKFTQNAEDEIEYIMEKKEAMLLSDPEDFFNKKKWFWKPGLECTPEEIEKSHDYHAEHEFPVMENVCNFYEKNDDIKEWSRKPEIVSAFIQILFDHYGGKKSLSCTMKEEMDDFKDEEKEEDRFLALFNFVGDQGWDEHSKDWVSIPQISVLLKKTGINLSAQKYKNYLTPKGAVKGKRLNEKSGKRDNCWINIQINDDKVEEICMNMDED